MNDSTPLVKRATSPWFVSSLFEGKRGLGWRNDWMSAQYLAEALEGEDIDRIPVEDVEQLLDLIELGLARRAEQAGADA